MHAIGIKGTLFRDLGEKGVSVKREVETEKRGCHCYEQIPPRCNLRERGVYLSSQFQLWKEGRAELTAMGICQSSLYPLGDPFLSSRPGPKGFITKAIREGRKGG